MSEMVKRDQDNAHNSIRQVGKMLFKIIQYNNNIAY